MRVSESFQEFWRLFGELQRIFEQFQRVSGEFLTFSKIFKVLWTVFENSGEFQRVIQSFGMFQRVSKSSAEFRKVVTIYVGIITIYDSYYILRQHSTSQNVSLPHKALMFHGNLLQSCGRRGVLIYRGTSLFTGKQ